MNDLEQIMRDEGKIAVPYLDSVGVWTVGYGHNMRNPLSDRVLAMIAQEDLAFVRQRLEYLLPDLHVLLSSVRWGVLLNMGFNLGIGGLLGFRKFLAALRQENWKLAAREMMDSKWAKQVGDRSARLRTQILEDRRV